ncbi:MAG: acyl--CoA ligase [Clostridiales bacterium]|nr:acyl--CoA ligase [Clostridiales bacterium]
MNDVKLTGKPSIDRPWMKYYPAGLDQIQIPECTLMQYLKDNCLSEDLTAMHYYGKDISWATFFQTVDAVAKSLRAVGFQEGDQIPVFLQTVPEFYYLLLAAEKIGASLLCRDNTLEENVEAVRKSGAKVIIAHDFLSQEALGAYRSGSATELAILVSPMNSGSYDALPDYLQNSLDALYPDTPASGAGTITWQEFLALGQSYTGTVEAAEDCHRPLYRAYTSGSTGPSKQVIHSANTMIGIIHQMNFYGAPSSIRPTWMHTILPPSLVAVVVSMTLLPLASNRILILDPFCDPQDVDLELMRYRPNNWCLIPMFTDTLVHSTRIPDDYDLSHLYSAGAGAESTNNAQLKTAQKWLEDHNCHVRFTSGYGSSEAGSNVSLPMTPHPMGNGNIGIPMPLTTLSVFKPGTQEELGCNQIGEICKTGPGNMLGYDDPVATAKTLQTHADGKVWLHMGDLGYMNEDGVFYVLTRGSSPRYQGGDLATLPMENLVADANIEGIEDEFFVIAPDEEHPGCFLPYLYVVLREGYTVEDIQDKVMACLKSYMRPVEIIQLESRPFFHFKTNRIGLIHQLQGVRS